MLNRNLACRVHPQSMWRPAFLRPLGRFGIGGLAFSLAAGAVFAGAPAIIPLPNTVQVRPGVFTLCPSQPVPGAPARATTRIVVDSPSLQTGQYLATTLFKSTGNQFTVATNGAAGPIRGAILLTTVNGLTSLGAEGYELTVAPDSVVVRAPPRRACFMASNHCSSSFRRRFYRPKRSPAWLGPPRASILRISPGLHGAG